MPTKEQIEFDLRMGVSPDGYNQIITYHPPAQT